MKVANADSEPGTSWTKSPLNPVMPFWANGYSIIYNGSLWLDYYSKGTQVYLATSPDGISDWTEFGVIFGSHGGIGRCFIGVIHSPAVLFEEGKYKMWYSGGDFVSSYICYATSDDGIHWNRIGAPIVSPTESGWGSGSNGISSARVLRDETGYKMYATGGPGVGF
jgi:hypothetical protein